MSNPPGAILWGCCWAGSCPIPSTGWFQSQGRFFGGAADCIQHRPLPIHQVSIAGAILWGCCVDCAAAHCQYPQGFNRRGDSLGVLLYTLYADLKIEEVSIAGAILWGCCLANADYRAIQGRFQSQGRFFGGAAHLSLPSALSENCFNRRGDSLGVLLPTSSRVVS